jgi:hypothetical protein
MDPDRNNYVKNKPSFNRYAKRLYINLNILKHAVDYF